LIQICSIRSFQINHFKFYETMFGFFKKDPIKKLEKKHAALLTKAMEVQRTGDLRHYAQLIEESETIQTKIDQLRNAK